MNKSSFVLWGLVGVLVAVAIAVSCADTTSNPCVLDDCISRCIAVGHAGGECRADACLCTEIPAADADADADGRDDAVTPPDVTDDASPPDTDVIRDEASAEDRVGEEIRRDADAVDRPDVPRPEDGSTPDSPADAKSGCDPLVCFMSCGGTCSVGGTCVCESP
jgi:hypothetical protein